MMSVVNVIAAYLLGGVVLSGSFEYLVYTTKYDAKKVIKNWERIFWITCWPFLLVKFLIAIFKR